MWQLLIINLYFSFYSITVKSAWVEIPQVPSKQPSEIPPIRKPAQFVLGTPKVSFVDRPTTPPNRMLTTVPTTTVTSYRDVMTSSTASPLTTTHRTRQREEFTTQKMQTQRPHTHSSKAPKTNKTEKTEDIYSGFMPLLQSIQETLTVNAKKSLRSKISLLTNLRDNLLTNIDERMSSLWSREDTSEARGHDDKEMDFPSNEGALMTIGFLTFAVFLIKLVLKLIHALKEKQMMNPMVVTTIAPSVAYIGRKKRQLEDDGLKILRFIEEYNFS